MSDLFDCKEEEENEEGVVVVDKMLPECNSNELVVNFSERVNTQVTSESLEERVIHLVTSDSLEKRVNT